MPYSEINGVRLHWELSGDTGEPLVLVHGSWVDHSNWDMVAPSLAQEYRVLRYDRRGHSRSERPEAQGSIREDVADLAGLIEELRLAPAHVIGSSFGGAIALQLAAVRPDLVRSLTVNEPPLTNLLAGEPAGQQMLQQVNEGLSVVEKLLAAGDMEGGVRFFVEDIIFGPGTWEQLPAEVRETVIFNAPTFLDELHDPEAFVFDPSHLRGFTRPVLLIVCDESPPPFQLVVQRLADGLPHAEIKTFAGARHEPEQTHAEEYVAVVNDFLRRQVAGMIDRRVDEHG